MERQTGVGREDDGDDGVQSCAADPVLNPEPQAAHEGTDDGGNGRALGSEYHLGQDGKTGAEREPNFPSRMEGMRTSVWPSTQINSA